MNPSTARIFLYPNQHKLLLAKKEDRALCGHVSAISQLAIMVDVPVRGFHPEITPVIRCEG